MSPVQCGGSCPVHPHAGLGDGSGRPQQTEQGHRGGSTSLAMHTIIHNRNFGWRPRWEHWE